MPESAWSQKRERQHEHIKEGLIERAPMSGGQRRSPPKQSTRNGRAAVKPRSEVAPRWPTSHLAGGVVLDPTAARAAGPMTSSATRPSSGESRAAPG